MMMITMITATISGDDKADSNEVNYDAATDADNVMLRMIIINNLIYILLFDTRGY